MKLRKYLEFVIFSFFLFSFSCFSEKINMNILSFQEVMKTVIENSPKIRALDEEEKVLELEKIDKIIPYLPSFSTSVNSLYHNWPNQRPGIGASLNMNVFRFGADYKNGKGIDKKIMSGKKNIKYQKLQYEEEVAKSIFSHIKDFKNLELKKRSVEVYVKVLKEIQSNYSNGHLPKEELIKAQIQLGNEKSSLRFLELSYENSKQELMAFLNLKNNKQYEIKKLWPFEKLFKDCNYSADKILTINKKNKNLRLEHLEFDYLAEQDFLSASKRSLFPSLNVSLNSSWSQEEKSSPWDHSISLGVNIPLFSGLRDYANYKKKIHKTYSNRYRYEQEKIILNSKEKELEATLSLSLKNIREQKIIFDLAKKLFQESLKRYENAHIPLNYFSLDLQRLLQAEGLYHESMDRGHQALIAIKIFYGKSICL